MRSKQGITRVRVLSAMTALGALASITPASQAAEGAYATAVRADGPLGYYRLNDSLDRPTSNLNIGSLGTAGNATNLNVRAYAGAIVGSDDRAQFFDSTARSIIPFNPALNPDATKPFTMEAWFNPLSDQINGGQAVINNRYAYSGAQRQGWVIFQRAPNDSYSGKGGYEGVGWNFRMYAGGNGIDVVANKPYELGVWVHFVAVYNPDDADGPKTTIYINGEAIASTVGNYVANTNDPRPEMVNGPAGLSFGAYNNTAVDGSGHTSQSNPYFGAVDEFAFYTNVLSDAKILAHYQNGTNSARSVSYESLIQSENPVAYLRMNEAGGDPHAIINIGELRNAGYFTMNDKVQRNTESALASDPNDGSIGTHRRNGAGTRLDLPFAAANNPPESSPFTVESWIRPLKDTLTPGAAVMNNRKASGNRSGWVIFQRAPNDTYTGQSGYEGVGWDFRMYTGVGSGGGADIATSVPYTVGEWQHVVFTWTPDSDTGNGNWLGTLRAYVNGEPAGENFGVYHANTDPTDNDSTPVDLAIGSYNAASNWGQEFDGDVDEVAIYNNLALRDDQVAAHYAAGTNAHPATAYASLVLSAPYQNALDNGEVTAQRMGPATYLRFNDPAPFPATNSGLLGAAADGSFQAASSNSISGPLGGGFDAGNMAGNFDGALGWLSLNNPDGLNFNGNITLEAWVLPSADQGAKARILSHGPALLSVFQDGAVSTNGSIFSSPEVYLQVADGNYSVGASDGTNAVEATFPATLGGTSWTHLAGTYDGANWKLYVNGALVATTAGSIGASVITNGDWAIGSTGMGWTDYYAGGIDEVAIYNKALTAAQIKAHFDASVGLIKIDSFTQTAGTFTLNWSGGSGKFLVQKKVDLNAATWFNVVTTTGHTATVTKDGDAGFYRIVGSYTGADVIQMTAYLSGDAEKQTSTVTTPATGVGSFSMEGNNLNYLITYHGLLAAPTASHIHGPFDSQTSGGVMKPFNTPVGTNGYITGVVALSDTQRDQVLNGLGYANIHTTLYPSGEIRGQVLRTKYVANMSGAGERPNPVVTSATGTATVNVFGNELTYSVNWTGLSGTATAGHIHLPATAEQTASPVVFYSAVSGATGSSNGSQIVGQNVLGALADGKAYSNIHTTANPGGEIRGQLAPAN